MNWRQHWWAIGFTVCLTAFTVYISLDTFVLSNAYQTDTTQMNLSVIEEKNPSGGDLSALESNAGTQDAPQTGSTGTQAVEESAGTQDAPQTSEPGTQDALEKEGSGHHRKKPGYPSHRPSQSRSSDGSAGGDGSGKPHRESEEAGDPDAHKPGSGNFNRDYNEEEAAASAAAVTTENEDSGSTQTYSDENIQITCKSYTTNGTTVHVADVQISSAEYLKTAFADDTYGKNITQNTSDIAASHGAVLAINGDYYGSNTQK